MIYDATISFSVTLYFDATRLLNLLAGVDYTIQGRL